MSKRAVLRFGGSIEAGFQVTLEVQENQTTFKEVAATLPRNPLLAEALEQWRDAYWRHVMGSDSGEKRRGISLVSIHVQPGPQTTLNHCRQHEQALQQCMSNWLASEGFRPIDQHLRAALNPQEEFQLLLRTDDRRLHQLPWPVWDFVEHYGLTELVFGSFPEKLYPPAGLSQKVRVLAILGDRRDIDTDVDRALLDALPDAEVTFLAEPSRSEVDDQLWDQSWDILFFAGHSYSEGHHGQISLNAQESLTIEQLRNGLKRAIAKGLQLAIFNSCDGLGIAYDLEALHLPQLVVMREPVPDRVAQAFLKYFLAEFSRGEALHLALRQARERLQNLDGTFPSPTWLPVLFQNPAIHPPTWATLRGERSGAEPGQAPQPHRPSPSVRLPRWLRTSWGLALSATLLVMAGRYAGALQPVELALFDHWLRSRPAESPDDRILIVNVTETDILAQPQEALQGRSLTDQTLLQLLTTLNALKPRSIGLDIYQEQGTSEPQLREQFAQNPALFAICKGGNLSASFAHIAKPPDMPDDRVGFSDIRSDADNIVRMQMLSGGTDGDSCLSDSLAVRLADDYLSKNDILLDFPPGGDIWQWQDRKLERIGASGLNWPSSFFHYGPYAGIDVQGHHFLLNYRASRQGNSSIGPTQAFPQTTLAQVLAGELRPKDVENKIVLIGVMLPDKDRWRTPYKTQEGKPLEIPGVHLHAQMTSQILSAVLDDRLLLRAMPFWLDSLGVFGVTLAALGLRCRSWLQPRQRTVDLYFISLYGVLLYAMGRVAYTLLGFYLPALPALLAFGFVSGLRLAIAQPAQSVVKVGREQSSHPIDQAESK